MQQQVEGIASATGEREHAVRGVDVHHLRRQGRGMKVGGGGRHFKGPACAVLRACSALLLIMHLLLAFHAARLEARSCACMGAGPAHTPACPPQGPPTIVCTGMWAGKAQGDPPCSRGARLCVQVVRTGVLLLGRWRGLCLHFSAPHAFQCQRTRQAARPPPLPPPHCKRA